VNEPAEIVHLTGLARAGDLAQLIDARQRTFQFVLTPGEQLHTHRGVVYHDALIGAAWGSQVTSHTGEAFYLIRPTLADLLLRMKRISQIIYPKDIGYILVAMGIGPGQCVLEAGTGSGGLTTALAYMVGPQGRVISYDHRPEMQELARKNLERLGLEQRVTFKLKDIGQGFDEHGVDALFLDVPNPEEYIPQVRAALQPGGPFGSLLPTTNQVSLLLEALKSQAFAFLEVAEILIRFYKPVPARLRPVDRMTAHTGYLIFARSMVEAPGEGLQVSPALNEDEAGGDLSEADG
jgi:tRNA (adenine57-N1/adenine58-N1)-methyltransferase